MKNEILKYLGILVILIGVVLLVTYHFGNYSGNGMLIAAGICIVVGTVGHIFLNKYIE